MNISEYLTRLILLLHCILFLYCIISIVASYFENPIQVPF